MASSESPRMLPADPRAVAAIHEAGHAVVSLVLRTGVQTVDIRTRSEGHEGRAKYRRPGRPCEGSRDVQERRGATALGGMAAVWLASGKQDAHRFSPGDMIPGLAYVYAIVGANPPKADAEACWDALYARAVAVLEERWTLVEATAGALVAETVIGRQRIIELMTDLGGVR